MKTQTYRADTLREALSRVRRDLGGSAVILGTREVRRRRLLGLGPRDQVEVVATTPERTAAAPAPSGPDSIARPALDDRLGRLHEAVEGLARAGRLDHLATDLPAPLVPCYARLLDLEVPESIARRVVRSAAEAIEPDEHHRPDAVADALRRAVAEAIPVAPPIAAVPGGRRVVALVGPTGVGKTTTVAKLAAGAKFGLGLRVGLATLDTYRIAAVEQLRTYAEIIDLPLTVADAPDRLRGAIDGLGAVDLVLLDTAGRSPRDEVKVRELADFLAAARPDEVHLVLSAAAGERSLLSAVERFEAVGFDRLLLTKLDEAEGLGALLGVVARAGRPLSYVTAGQAVPDDIEPADRDHLATLILGREAIA